MFKDDILRLKWQILHTGSSKTFIIQITTIEEFVDNWTRNVFLGVAIIQSGLVRRNLMREKN